MKTQGVKTIAMTVIPVESPVILGVRIMYLLKSEDI